MNLTARNGLDRTATLVSSDILGGKISESDVVIGLTRYRAEIRATAAALHSPAAQTATVTLALHLAMCGISVNLAFPEVATAGAQPPLQGTDLKSNLRDHLRSTWPWITVNADAPLDVRFLIGETPPVAGDDIIVSGCVDRISIGSAHDIVAVPWTGSWPIAPAAAGIAAAAVAVRMAIRAIAAHHAIDSPVVLSGPDATSIIIDTAPAAHRDLGVVPVVSAGAITQAAIYVALRVDGLTGRLEVYDDDVFDVPNLNRYSLMTSRDIAAPKAASLERWSAPGLELLSQCRRYQAGDGAGARRLLVGADDIAVRWTAQDDVAGWLGIGATSHLFAQVSTHSSGTPCSGCVHDHEDPVPETIPTISIVSGWAGLMLANELLRSVDRPGRGTTISGYPLGLGGRNAHLVVPAVLNPRCRRKCASVSQVA